MKPKYKTRIIRIGKELGVPIPKAALREFKESETLEIQLRGAQIVIGRPVHPRAGWEQDVRRKRSANDQDLWDGLVSASTWDDTEWEW
jgi:antitoxin component of MazEF toxin-antitoxin module